MGDHAAPVKAPKYLLSKYDPDYNKFRFIMANSDAELKNCVKCGEILKWALSYERLQKENPCFNWPAERFLSFLSY